MTELAAVQDDSFAVDMGVLQSKLYGVLMQGACAQVADQSTLPDVQLVFVELQARNKEAVAKEPKALLDMADVYKRHTERWESLLAQASSGERNNKQPLSPTSWFDGKQGFCNTRLELDGLPGRPIHPPQSMAAPGWGRRPG